MKWLQNSWMLQDLRLRTTDLKYWKKWNLQDFWLVDLSIRALLTIKFEKVFLGSMLFFPNLGRLDLEARLLQRFHPERVSKTVPRIAKSYILKSWFSKLWSATFSIERLLESPFKTLACKEAFFILHYDCGKPLLNGQERTLFGSTVQ